MNKTIRYLLIALAALVAMGAIGLGLAYFSMQPDSDSPLGGTDSSNNQKTGESSSATNQITTAQLAQNNGIDGNECYVAIDGTVYLIKGVAEWAMGRHTPADSSVTCGKDLTEKLKESPHGAKVLKKLPVIGTLQP